MLPPQRNPETAEKQSRAGIKSIGFRANCLRFLSVVSAPPVSCQGHPWSTRTTVWALTATWLVHMTVQVTPFYLGSRCLTWLQVELASLLGGPEALVRDPWHSSPCHGPFWFLERFPLLNFLIFDFLWIRRHIYLWLPMETSPHLNQIDCLPLSLSPAGA